MKIDLYTSAGEKNGSVDLPAAVFEAPINQGLMHTALVMQQSNRRKPIAHVKSRGEVAGSTRKLFRQKGTGRARKGSANSPILRSGGRAFGPRNVRNFIKDMPRKMRRNALLSCLSSAAQNNRIIALEGYGEDPKTKTFATMLGSLPVSVGRKIIFVLPQKMNALENASRNVPGVKTLLVDYLNPEDVLGAHHIVFLVDAIKIAEEKFAPAVTPAPAKS